MVDFVGIVLLHFGPFDSGLVVLVVGVCVRGVIVFMIVFLLEASE